MTAPVFLLTDLATATPGGHVTVSGDEGHHGAAVRRLRPAEEVHLVDGRGRRVAGTVSDVGRRDFAVLVQSVTDEPPAQPSITVVQGLAKGDRSEAAVAMLTECGVDRIVPWAAQRSVAAWRGDRADKGHARWVNVSLAAMKQSRRCRAPAIDRLSDTHDVATLLASARLGLVLHESAAARLAHVTPPDTGEVVLVIGPEGGIADEELAAFGAVGALPVRMGDSVMRTSTAGVAAAAVVLARSRRWD